MTLRHYIHVSEKGWVFQKGLTCRGRADERKPKERNELILKCKHTEV